MSSLQEIADSLSVKQRAQLEEVANLMLEIYRTLERMRYLEPGWIQPGPHDITALLPQYQSLNLDPSIIYLYSILPYIDPVFTSRLEFYQAGEFTDFRNPQQVTQGRDPFGADTPQQTLRPWMTPLSLWRGQSPYSDIILYDARSHRVCITCKEKCASSRDRNFHEGELHHTHHEDKPDRWFRIGRDGKEENLTEAEYKELSREKYELLDEEVTTKVATSMGERGRRVETWGEDGDITDQDDEEEDDEDEDSEDDNDSVEENEDENYFDSMQSRPAPNVLRDIIRWHHELEEVPERRDEKHSTFRYPPYPRRAKILYRKHGWPGPDFDGDAFLVDHLRTEAVETVYSIRGNAYRHMECQWHSVNHAMDDKEDQLAEAPEKLAAAKNLDEEWVVHWELWEVDANIRSLEKTQERYEGIAKRAYGDDFSKPSVRPEDVPLWELKQVQAEFYKMKRALDGFKREEPFGGRTEEQIQKDVRYEEKRMAVCQKAIDASRADAERLCPGRELFALDIYELAGTINLPEKIDELTFYSGNHGELAAEIREWLSRAPEEAKQARDLAQAEAERYEWYCARSKAELDGFVEELEKLKGSML